MSFKITCNINTVADKLTNSEAWLGSNALDCFLVKESPVDNKEIAENSIHIRIPNNIIGRSKHTCYLREQAFQKEWQNNI